MFGQIVAVESLLAGTQLVGAHSSGVSELQVIDVSQLTERGGTVVVDGDDLDYTSVTDLSNPETTASNDIITLAAPTSAGYAAGAQVSLTPVRPYKIALVVLTGDEQAVEALIPHALFDKIAEGPRQGNGELVSLGERDDSLIVTDVLGRTPTVDASFIAPNTLKSSAIDQADFASSGVINDIAGGTFEKPIHRATTPPVDTTQLWLDTT